MVDSICSTCVYESGLQYQFDKYHSSHGDPGTLRICDWCSDHLGYHCFGQMHDGLCESICE